MCEQTCIFCGTTEGYDAAVDSGWTAYFYDANAEGDARDDEHGPACPACAAKNLHKGEDGEIETWPGVTIPSED